VLSVVPLPALLTGGVLATEPAVVATAGVAGVAADSVSPVSWKRVADSVSAKLGAGGCARVAEAAPDASDDVLAVRSCAPVDMAGTAGVRIRSVPVDVAAPGVGGVRMRSAVKSVASGTVAGGIVNVNGKGFAFAGSEELEANVYGV
jgi:hypothetical protein